MKRRQALCKFILKELVKKKNTEALKLDEQFRGRKKQLSCDAICSLSPLLTPDVLSNFVKVFTHGTKIKFDTIPPSFTLLLNRVHNPNSAKIASKEQFKFKDTTVHLLHADYSQGTKELLEKTLQARTFLIFNRL